MAPVALQGRDGTQAMPLVIPAIAQDGSLYPVEKLDAHRRGLKHLAVSVFVFAGDELLVQRRAAGKYHCGGLWANTCCTHPHWDETPEACAARRLREEVGIELPLSPRAVVDYRAEVTNGLIENERVHVFEGALPAVVPVTRFDRNEVSELRWVRQAVLRREIARRPQDFTPWLRIYVDRWAELELQAAA
ncbi:MAG: NUDIX domain-containing protein [Mesorhizobium sp.]|nr:NUDIX domain-containing protein [Mesorhizobium sp.]